MPGGRPRLGAGARIVLAAVLAWFALLGLWHGIGWLADRAFDLL